MKVKRKDRIGEYVELLPKLCKKTLEEDGAIYYGFTQKEGIDDEFHCREAYIDGEAVLAHMANVGGELFDKLLELSEITSFLVMGPSEELEKLKGKMPESVEYWSLVESANNWSRV